MHRFVKHTPSIGYELNQNVHRLISHWKNTRTLSCVTWPLGNSTCYNRRGGTRSNFQSEEGWSNKVREMQRHNQFDEALDSISLTYFDNLKQLYLIKLLGLRGAAFQCENEAKTAA